MDWIERPMYLNGHLNSSTSQGRRPGRQVTRGPGGATIEQTCRKNCRHHRRQLRNGIRHSRTVRWRGAYVYITGRREEELHVAVAKIGENVAAVQGDVSNLEDLDRLYAKIAEEKGRVGVVFANAGVGNQMAPLGSITEEQIDRTFSVNVRGLIFTVQKALPLMHDRASIILYASSASIKGIGSLSVYAGSKAAVRSLARSWTTDMKDRSIRVNATSPGYTEMSIFETLDWTKEQFEGIKAGITKTIPLGRWADSEEIAKAAIFWLLRKAAMWLVSNCSLTAVPFRFEVGTHATISGLYCQYSSPLVGPSAPTDSRAST